MSEKINVNGVEVELDTSDKESDQNKYIDDVLNGIEDQLQIMSEKANDQETNEPEHNDSEEVISSKGSIYVSYNTIMLLLVTMIPIIQLCAIIGATAKTCMIVFFVGTVIEITFYMIINDPTMLIVECIFGIVCAGILTMGVPHGLIGDDVNTKSVMKIYTLNMNTPKKYVTDVNISEKEIIDMCKGKFVYYYKYGCPDCVDIYTDLTALLEEKGCEVIAIETRSDFGKKMLNQYPAYEVPAGLVITKDGNYQIETLYKKSTDGTKSVIDMEHISKLLEAIGD